MIDSDYEKKNAAIASVRHIEDGMLVGLGSGSTAAHMIRELGKKVAEGLSIKAVPSSNTTAELARKAGITLISLEEAGTLDINIDGADEFDAKLQLIKGGGGALLREKILAYNSRLNIVISDASKQVERLGKFKLPLETIPFATINIIGSLVKMGLKPVLRKKGNEIYKTDEQNFIVDVDVLEENDLVALNQELINIPGIVETGLFLNTTDMILMGKENDTIIFKR